MEDKTPQKDEALDLESIIEEFRDLPDSDLPDSGVPEDMLPEEQQEPAKSAVTGDTIRMDASQLPKGSYTGAAPLDEPDEPAEPAEAAEAAPTEAAEPFSDQWEPDYEQPMGEYVPPQPIVFHPTSRRKELKKKLVTGPEKRYYQLSEKGTGRLQVLLLVASIISLLCIGSTVLYQFGMVQADRIRLMIFGQLLAMFISALLGSFQLIEGLADLVRGRFSLNTLLLFSFILCCADGFLCLQELRVPCCAAFTLQVFLSLFDTLHRRRIEISQMDVLRKATDLTAVRVAAQDLDGRKVLVRDEGQVEDFMDHYAQRTAPEKIRSWYAIGALGCAVAVGVTGGILHGVSMGVQIAAVTLLAAVPASFFVCLSRPADLLQRRYHKLGTLLCGWRGVEAACGKAVFPLNHSDLFPAGAVKMNGVKFFGSRDPDEVVAYGAALVMADNNGLAPLFEQVLESRNCHHLTATELQLYDGGISGLVRGEPVMAGTLSFMKEMGVELPEGLRVSQAVCVAVDGVLSGLFAISYEKTRSATGGLHTLCAYRNLQPVLCDGDFLLSPGFLRARFGINPKKLRIADAELRAAMAEKQPEEAAPALVLSTQRGLAPLAYGITGARALHTASWLGLWVHIAGGVIGIGIMLTLTIIGAAHLLTPLPVFLYQLVWSIPGILITEWARLV